MAAIKAGQKAWKERPGEVRARLHRGGDIGAGSCSKHKKENSMNTVCEVDCWQCFANN